MKKIVLQICLLFVMLTAFGLPLAVQASNQGSILHPKGLLWKIEKPDSPASYLYGTMHVGDPRVVNLAPEVENAFVNADRFAMEMLLNFRALGIITSRSFFSDGRNLKSVMDEQAYQQLIDLLNNTLHLSEDVIINMRPWAALMMLYMPTQGQMDENAALDMVLYRRAAMRKIPLLGLETAEEQLAVFESLTLEEQVWMLNKAVEDYHRYRDQFLVMMDAYLDRDLDALFKMQQKYMYAETDIDDRLMHELVDKRNVRMVERMQSFLQQGNAFIAIGALHLPGEQGVLHLLEQQGYSVTPLY